MLVQPSLVSADLLLSGERWIKEQYMDAPITEFQSTDSSVRVEPFARRTPAPMTTLETLQQAREVIAEPEHWCRGFHSRNGQHCAAGAILEVMRGDVEIEGHAAAAAIIGGVGECAWQRLMFYNDAHSHGEVLRLFDLAIDRLSRRANDHG